MVIRKYTLVSWLRPVVCCAAFSVGLVVASGQESIPVEGYAAIVNDRIILISEVMSRVQEPEDPQVEEFSRREYQEKFETLYGEVLELLVERALILEEFERNEGEVPDRAVDEHMEVIIRKKFGGDRRLLLEALADDEITIDEWRTRLKEDLVVQSLRGKEVADKIVVTPGDIVAFYETRRDQYSSPAMAKVRMIKIAKGKKDEEKILQAKKAKRARTRIASGESFEAVARDLSEGRTAASGGDWGWIKPSDLRKELVEVIETIEVGALSHGFVAGDFIYLITVEDRRLGRVVPFEEVQGELERELRKQRIDELHAAWVKRLKEQNYVKIF